MKMSSALMLYICYSKNDLVVADGFAASLKLSDDLIDIADYL